jgi:hypothetical protein
VLQRAAGEGQAEPQGADMLHPGGTPPRRSAP